MGRAPRPRRAHWVFETVLCDEKGVGITSCPSAYDTFDPERWWEEETGRELVFGEYVRLLSYVIKRGSLPFPRG